MNSHPEKQEKSTKKSSQKQDHSLVLESQGNLEKIQQPPSEEASKADEETEVKKVPPFSFLKTFNFFLLNVFEFFLQILFSKKESQPRFMKKREQKQTLEHFKFHFYTTSLQKIEIAFPQYIYTIYHSLKKLEETLPEIILSKLPLERKFFLLEWVAPILPEESRLEIESTHESYFRELITNSKDSEKIFQSFLKDWEKKIQQSNLETFKTYNQYLENFYNLLRFDFVRLFKLFDPSFKEELTPSFQPLFGKKGLKKLMELDCYFQSISFSSIPENVRIHLEETLSRVFGENAPFSSSVLSFLLERIQELNNKKILGSMIQLISEDYNYVSTSVSIRVPFFKHYLDLIKKKKLFEYHALAQKIKMEVIHKNMAQLFQHDLSPSEHYNETLNELLQKNRMKPLQYILAIQMLQNFWVRFYVPSLGKQIHTLLVNGNFIQKIRVEQVSESYYQLEENISRLNELAGEIIQQEKEPNNFSKEIQPTDNPESEKRLREILRFAESSSSSSTKTHNPVIGRKIQEWEKELFNILKKILRQYQNLEPFLADTSQDWENKINFKFLRNARTIKGNGNEEFFTEILMMKDKLNILIQSLEILLNP